jgi:hypothetical protein
MAPRFVTSAIGGGDFSNLSPSPFISGVAAPHYPLYWKMDESRDGQNSTEERKVVPVENRTPNLRPSFYNLFTIMTEVS